MIHNKKEMVRRTLKAVRLEVATKLLLLRGGGVFIAGACNGV